MTLAYKLDDRHVFLLKKNRNAILITCDSIF